MKSFEFRNNTLDLIRLIAALQVVVVHSIHHLEIDVSQEIMSWLSRFPGVPIFFVVSGYLISASYQRSDSIIHYYQNRFLRIYPGLWFCFLVSVISILLFSSAQLELASFSKWSAAQLTIVQFYNPDFLRDYGVGVINGSLWTIPVELQFYIILPVLWWLFKIGKSHSGQLILFGLFVIFLIFNVFFMAYREANESLLTKLITVTVLPYLYIFLIGIFLQRNLWFVEKVLFRKFWIWLLLYLSTSFILERFDFTIGGNYLNPISATLLALTTIAAAYSFSEKTGKILKGNDISYGVYIYHMVVINVLVEHEVVGSMISFIIVLTVTLLLSLFSWLVIEKKALGLKSYSLRRQRL